MQYVSSTPATRLDVINLQEKLDQQLQQRQVCQYRCMHQACIKQLAQFVNTPSVLSGTHAVQARETGICPVREELYSQCLDELIRQVTISCAERGLLLLRVRDEMRMTTSAYQVSGDSVGGLRCACWSKHAMLAPTSVMCAGLLQHSANPGVAAFRHVADAAAGASAYRA